MAVALALLAMGAVVVWMAVTRLSSGQWPEPTTRASDWVAGLTWGSHALLTTGAATALLGVVLLLCAVLPGRPNGLRIDTEPLETDRGTVEAVMTRRAVAKLANARAREVDGVDTSSATVRARSVDLSVITPSIRRDELQQTVTSRVRAALEETGLQPVPTVATTVRTRRL